MAKRITVYLYANGKTNVLQTTPEIIGLAQKMRPKDMPGPEWLHGFITAMEYRAEQADDKLQQSYNKPV